MDIDEYLVIAWYKDSLKWDLNIELYGLGIEVIGLPLKILDLNSFATRNGVLM
jgi:hypothetical protein